MAADSPQFEAAAISPALRRDALDPLFPTELRCWTDDTVELPKTATTFCFVFSGTASLECASGTFSLRPGMYAAVPGRAVIRGGTGIAVSRLEQRGLFQLGGPIESTGRLRYIDGCTDTLLIAPPVRGDACLNLLHIPPGTEQTRHTHPSVRVGMIVSGSGICRTPQADHPLEAGTVFVIPPGGEHSFHTQNDALRVIAYHPDSDCGPDHHDHPMVNRTIVDGVSARHLPAIVTRNTEPSGSTR